METLFSATESYADQHCPGYEGILAIHTHVLALHYVNESYNPSLALAYSRMAELNYTAYLRGLNGRERETALLYQYQVWVICAPTWPTDRRRFSRCSGMAEKSFPLPASARHETGTGCSGAAASGLRTGRRSTSETSLRNAAGHGRALPGTPALSV